MSFPPWCLLLVLFTSQDHFSSMSSCGDSSERLLELGLGSDVVWRYILSGRVFYSGDIEGIPGILGNKENLTFPRITSMVENGNRYQRKPKNKLADCAGFSGWAKLGL
ncbi:hypothetical protein Bca4012_088321 [Brassica carinata]